MRIDKLKIENFKNFKDLNVDFAPGINLFVGSNGSGKTSLLEAINVALGGFFGEQEPKMQRMIELSEVSLVKFEDKLQRASKTLVKANSTAIGQDWSRTFNSITKNNDTKNVRAASTYGNKVIKSFAIEGNRDLAPLIAYYSTQRLFKDASQSFKQKYDAAVGRRNGYLQCLKDNAIKGTLVEWLGNAVTRRATKQIKDIEQNDLVLENVELAIKKTLVNFLDLEDDFSLKIYQEPDFDFELFINYDDEHDLPLSYYSDGFRNLIYLVIDLIWRASQLNPWLNLEEIKKQVTGCVTIDEIDLHLHPKWQAKCIILLQELLPKIQFFITTHSPTVVANFKERLSADEKNIDVLFILENNTYSKVSASFYGKDVNSVLSNPMDANIRAIEVVELIKYFNSIVENPESTEDEYKLAFEVAKKMNDLLPGSDKEVLRVNEIIERIKTAGK
jgi:predicted ATP-binding protein involved in virulence